MNHLRKCRQRTPHAPADDCIAVAMSRGTHDARINKFCANVGIDHTNDKSRNNNKSEGTLPVAFGSKTTKGRRSRVLPQISESDCRRNDEQECGDASQDSQGFGEVLWLFHLGDERREEDLGY